MTVPQRRPAATGRASSLRLVRSVAGAASRDTLMPAESDLFALSDRGDHGTPW